MQKLSNACMAKKPLNYDTVYNYFTDEDIKSVRKDEKTSRSCPKLIEQNGQCIDKEKNFVSPVRTARFSLAQKRTRLLFDHRIYGNRFCQCMSFVFTEALQESCKCHFRSAARSIIPRVT